MYRFENFLFEVLFIIKLKVIGKEVGKNEMFILEINNEWLYFKY